MFFKKSLQIDPEPLQNSSKHQPEHDDLDSWLKKLWLISMATIFSYLLIGDLVLASLMQNPTTSLIKHPNQEQIANKSEKTRS